MTTFLIRPSLTKHCDKTWSWQVFVFPPRDRTKDAALPSCVYIHEKAAFTMAGCGPDHPNRRAALADMKRALKLVGLDKAPTT